MVIKAPLISPVGVPPNGTTSFVIPARQLYKGLYLETIGRLCQLVLSTGQNLVVTDLESFVALPGLNGDSFLIKTGSLPPGCEILIRGKNLQIKRIENHKTTLEIVSASSLHIGISSDIEEFMRKTGKKGITELMIAIQTL